MSLVSDHEGSIRQVVDNASNRVVQVMDYDAFGNLIAASLPSSVHAYSTGAAGDGSGGDSHWTILGGSVTTQRHATIVTSPSSAWVTAPSGSQWIGIHSDNTSDSNADSNHIKTYTYTTTITIDAGSTVSSISGMLAADNELNDGSGVSGISVNGVSSGITVTDAPYTRWHGFTLSGLHAGSNTVVFTVRDWGGATGLAVEWGVTQPDPSDTTQLPRFLFQGMQWDNTPQLYEMGSGIDYVDPKTNRRLSQDPGREGTNLYAIEANNDNSNRDYNGANVAFGGSNFGYLDPSKLSVTNINVGGNVGTSSPSELNLSGTYLAGSGAGMFSAGGGATRTEQVVTVQQPAEYAPQSSFLQGLAGGIANTGNVISFGGTFALGDWYHGNTDWRADLSGPDYRSGIAAATAGRELLITAATLGSAQAYRAGGQAAYGLAAGAGEVYSTYRNGESVINGIQNVQNGNNWGYLQAGLGLLGLTGNYQAATELTGYKLAFDPATVSMGGLGGIRIIKNAENVVAKTPLSLPLATEEFRDFQSFDSLKSGLGSAGEGNVWHHIVEQRAANIQAFGEEAIHNTGNVVGVPIGVNQTIANYYSSKQLFTGGQTVRMWLGSQSYQDQFSFGQQILDAVQKGNKLP